MKPGELERNLSRLVEATRAARERLAAMERDLAELRLEMERLATEATATAPRRGREHVAGADPQGAAPGRRIEPDRADDDTHGMNRRDRGEPAARPGNDQPGREASSE